jgi:hypothetical protein
MSGMSTDTATRPVTVASHRATVTQLARIEARRYARHPLFLAGFALCALASAGEFGPIELDYHVIPSFFIGVLGIVVAARLTVSTDRSGPVIGATPMTETARTAALCLACLVPTVAGAAIVLMHRAFVLADPFPPFMYGTYGPADRFASTVVVPIVACAGGPLLGVAVGRWWRFPAASLLAVVVTVFWSNIAGYLPDQSSMDPTSLVARVLHMLTPYTAFASGNGDGEHPTTVLTTYTGSPTWFAVWTVALCGIAAATALLHRAEGQTRDVVRRWLLGLVVVAAVALVLAIALGNQQLFESTDHGTVAALAAAHLGR